MRTSEDVLRSVKKYVAELVLPAYEVRLTSEEGAWERPFVRVAWSTPMGLRTLGKTQVECRRTLNLVVWPLEDAAPDVAKITAEGVVERMTVAFAMGLHTPSYRASSNRAHPRRIPIYDYAGIAANKLATVRAATDFASIVEEPDVGDIEDPNTENSRLIVVNLRLRWTRSVGVATPGAAVVGVKTKKSP